MKRNTNPQPNVKIELFLDDTLYFLFDIDNGEYRYDYRPDDRNWDTRADSKDYRRADAYRIETETLTEYLEDQADRILKRFAQVLETEFKYGFVDTCQIDEELNYAAR